MGNLLRILAPRDKPGDDIQDVFVDFEKCQPTEDELPLWTKVNQFFQAAKGILLEMQQYKGASEEIRQAISNPRNEDMQDKAWLVVTPLVVKLKQYYEFSLALADQVPELLKALCSIEMTPKEHLQSQQALVKQFAEILDFVLKFDDLKLTNPVIQNDFSYYRRTQSRRRMANQDKVNGEEECVSNEMANRMSLFYANATPMLTVLSETTARFVSQHKDIPVENTTDCLATMANICRVMIETPEYCSRFEKEDTKFFCLRVMVGVIILYDHVHHLGAFHKGSSIDIKSSIKLLKDIDIKEPGRVEGLISALKFTTKHLNDDSTPGSVKKMLAQ